MRHLENKESLSHDPSLIELMLSGKYLQLWADIRNIYTFKTQPNYVMSTSDFIFTELAILQ